MSHEWQEQVDYEEWLDYWYEDLVEEYNSEERVVTLEDFIDSRWMQRLDEMWEDRI